MGDQILNLVVVEAKRLIEGDHGSSMDHSRDHISELRIHKVGE
jgi:hypothetical protein